ncbi:MAG: DNA replication/repair protein RecF [Porphyromonadaceae bacterium]|nr:DNA replication/repair protein RecF [Porphyromonadaceae bacterium]
MQLKKIDILNYRNIENCELFFSPKINLFWGKNGMGKTNLLDAIYYLSFCKSHLNNIDSQLIRHNCDFFIIQGEYNFIDGTHTISCAVKQRRKKQFLYDKKEYERIADHIGKIPLVLVSPADTSLIIEGSDERRRFMDIIISQYDKEYLNSLITYNTALQSRNALLKHPNNQDETMLEVLDEQLCATAEPIFEARNEFITKFIPVFKEFYRRIANNNETVELSYISSLQTNRLKDKLLSSREKDKYLGYTTAGIHKDDLEMLLNGFALKRTGSQGQNKSYLVAMKLAQFIFLKNISGKTPILLLDDIFDKLDSERVERIIKEISDDNFGQIFITDTAREHIDKIIENNNKNFCLFAIEDGKVIK